MWRHWQNRPGSNLPDQDDRSLPAPSSRFYRRQRTRLAPLPRHGMWRGRRRFQPGHSACSHEAMARTPAPTEQKHGDEGRDEDDSQYAGRLALFGMFIGQRLFDELVVDPIHCAGEFLSQCQQAKTPLSARCVRLLVAVSSAPIPPNAHRVVIDDTFLHTAYSLCRSAACPHL